MAKMKLWWLGLEWQQRVMKINEPFQANILKAESCGVSDPLYEAWWERMMRKKKEPGKVPEPTAGRRAMPLAETRRTWGPVQLCCLAERREGSDVGL